MAAVVAVTTSCQKEEKAIGDEVIVFRTEDRWADDEPETKAAQKSGFTSGDRMGVYAYYVPSGGTLASNGSKYFENQQVNYNGSTWSYTPAHYYPVTGTLSFRAYYPYSGGSSSNGIITSSTSNTLTITYQTPAALADQPDLVVASVDGQNSGIVNFTGGNNFTHILAAVKFTVGGLTAGFALTKVEFTGIVTSGSYNYPAWSPTSTGTINHGDGSTAFYTHTSQAEGTNMLPDNNCFMLIPQSFGSSSEAKITISYTKNSTPGTCEISLAGTSWTAGGSYAYKLSE